MNEGTNINSNHCNRVKSGHGKAGRLTQSEKDDSMSVNFWAMLRRRKQPKHRRKTINLAIEPLEERYLLTNWTGEIPNGTVWPAGEVQRIVGDVHIPLGSTLTIQPGAVVKFNNNSDIDFIVDGTLLAQGTDAQPIVFTELRDDTGGDTNGDGTASGPSRSNWGAVIIQPGSTGSTLEHFELRYGGWRAAAELVVNGGQLAFDHGVIRDADFYGVRITNASPTLTNISFVGSGFAAISMDLNSAPVISGVTMTNNGWNGLWLDSGTLPGNATWNNPDIVYILPDDVTVPQGKTLTLGAGQIIKTGFRTELFVNGTLIANGTTANPVIFANPLDDTAGGDTNNNGTANSAINDASGGIVFANTSVGNLLDHVEVRNSGYDVSAAIVVNGAPITITNSVFRNSVAAGLSLNGSTATITGTVFQNSSLEAVNATLTSIVTMNGNTFSNNGINGLLMRGGSLAADATWNNPDTVYVLQDDVTVPQGKTLTIGAGQIIKTGFRTELFVNGKLNVNGTADKPAIFASPSDDTAGGDTNNNGNTSPNNDPSGGIVFSATSTGSVLNHVEVRNSGIDDNAAIMVNGASITVTNSVIRDNPHAGIWMTGGTMSISNTDFQRNAWLAIAADVASNITSGGGNTFSQSPVNGLVVLSGTLPANTSWNNPDITYVFDGNGGGVTIPVGVTLTIGAGQIIKVTNQREAFIVNGTLKALGTDAAPVICTSFDDDSVGGDSNNNGGATEPHPGDWRSWSFTATSTNSALDHVELRYGNDGDFGARPGMLNVAGSALTVSNSVFTRSAHLGIGARSAATLTLINNLIVNNLTGAGVQAAATSQLIATNNTIDGNGFGIILDSPTATLTNNLISNSINSGIWQTGPTNLTMSFNDVYNPNAINYRDFPSQTGTNGNISVDPKYFNRQGGQYQLKPGSPVEDAGTNVGAPLTDFYGNPRFKDPNLPGRGNGSGYDMGAIEVQQIATSDVDLATTAVSGPATGQQGGNITVTWTVQSVGSVAATGAWRDAVYLSPSPIFTADAILLGTVNHSGDLPIGQSYNASGNFVLPGVTPGNYYILVRTNSQNEVFEAAQLANNTSASSQTISTSLPSLVLGAPTTGTLTGTGAGVLYQVTVPAGSDLNLNLTGPAGKTNELYVAFGTMPTRQSFDARSVRPGIANQSLTVSNTQAGTYYILVYGANVPSSEQFQITASSLGFALESVSPSQGGNTGLVTLTISGSQFDANSHPQLMTTGGITIQPQAVYYIDSGLISATFDMTGAPTGAATMQVINTGNVTQSLPQAFNIIAGKSGTLTTNISTPDAVRRGRTYAITIEYANTGDTDLLAPILNVTGANSDPLSFSTDFTDATNSLTLIGVNPNGPAGVLPPGAHGTITIYAAANTSGSNHLQLTIGGYPGLPMDWEGIEPLIRPDGIPVDQWQNFVGHLAANIGDTWDDFARVISRDATLLPSTLGRNTSLTDVFQLEIAKVKGQLQPALTGHVYLGDTNRPLGNATIVLGVPETGAIYFATSLTDGSFLIPFIDAGTYEVEIQGFITGTTQIVVGDDGLSNVQFVAASAGTISGRIVNSQGAAIPGIVVAAAAEDGTSYPATTMEDGSYVIDALPAGTYEIEAGGGNLTISIASDITVISGGRTANINLVLQTAATISGTVIGPNGPVEGAHVTAADEDGAGAATTTDASGHYTLTGLSSGLYSVTFMDSDLAIGRTDNVSLNAGTSLAGINVTLAAGGAVTGQLQVSGTGAPAAGMLVTLTGSSDSFSGFTDEDGEFLIKNLPAGNYTVVASLSAFMTTQAQVTVTANQISTANLTTNALGTVKGQVTDSVTQTPLAKVIVQVVRDSVLVDYALTDASGHYEIAGLDAGNYQVVLGDIGSPGIATSNIAISSSQPHATSNLSTALAGSVAGKVVLADGVTPAEGVIVSLISQGTQVLFMTTDSSGNYVFDILQSGTYSIIASAAGVAFPPRTGIAVNGGQALTGLNFRAGQQVLSGTVRDQASNQPLAGATVGIAYTDPVEGLLPIEFVTTANDGTFSIPGAIPGTWSITVSAAGHATKMQSATVPASGAQTVTVSLDVSSVLVGTVRDATTSAVLADATLQLIGTGGTQVLATAISDASGHYQIDGLTPGSYRLLIERDGRNSVLLNNVTVGTGSTLRDLALESSTTAVTGTAFTGSFLLERAIVQIRDAQGLIWSTTTADDTGKYLVSGLPAGQYFATASVLGYQSMTPASFTLAANQSLADFNLSASAVAITDADPPAGGTASSPDVARWFKALAENDPNNQTFLLPDFASTVPCPNPTASTASARKDLSTSVVGYNNALVSLFNKWPKLQKLKISFEQYFQKIVSAVPENWQAVFNLLGEYSRVLSLGEYLPRSLFNDLAFAKIHLEQLRTTMNKIGQVPDSSFASELNARRVSVADDLKKLFDHYNALKIQNGRSDALDNLARNLFDFRTSLSKLNSDNLTMLKLIAGLEQYETAKERYNDAARQLIRDYDKLVQSCNCGATQKPVVPYKPTPPASGSSPNISDVLLNALGTGQRQQLVTTAAAGGIVCVMEPVKPVGEPQPEPGSGGQNNPPDKAPISEDGGDESVEVEDAFDPNDFTGPAGFGPQKFIQSQLMAYRVDFENDPAHATAAAQIVSTTFTLDTDLDPSTLQFTGFGFGSFEFPIPEGLFHYQTTLDLRPHGINLLVPVSLDENPVTGIVTVKFESLDPLTNLPPDGVNDGFLPIDNPAGDGQGYFTFTVQPKSSLPTGRTITGQTGIVFDSNAPVQTPEALNTIDAGSPSSAVTSLPSQSPASFTVNWSGSDDVGGSGIANYDVYVSIDGGDYTVWQSAITTTSGIYTGQAGKSYRFYSVAHDNVGHDEMAPLTADTQTTVANLPPEVANQSFNVAENSAVNTIVGTVEATGSSALNYDIMSGNTGNNFTIDQTTGNIKVAAGATLNFEGTTTYTLTVQVTDSGSPSKSSTAAMTIHVTDVNEAPVIPPGQTFNISASALSGAVVGSVTANDPDIAGSNSTKTFSLPIGSTIFAINSAGQISVVNAAALAAVAGQTITLQVTDTDGGTSPLSDSESVSITVSPANTAPVLSTPGPVSTFYGNLKTPVKVAPTLAVTDADGAATIATIIVSLPQGAVKKNPDIVSFPGLTAIGTDTAVEASGRKQIVITLKPGTTNTAVQTMLNNMTFETKGKGLKVLNRGFKIEVIDQTGLHSNVVTQNVIVAKKAPKQPKPPRNPM